MGFLSPLLLLAAAAAAVPILLHLIHRHDARRVAFPALRYLLRTEREHARRIRLRQWLLLMLRVAIVMLLVGAAARPFLRRAGDAHDPTALAIVLDNSLSTGLVEQDERVLDLLKRAARATLEQGSPEDRVWVIRAGEPGDVAVPGTPEQALGRVDATQVSAAGADLAAALERAAALVRNAGLPAAEVHLLSDLQASALPEDATTPAGDVPLLIFHPATAAPGNHHLRDLAVGGGLPPLAGQRSEVSVTVAVPDADSSAVPLPLRLVVDGRIRAAASATSGAAAILPFGPFPEGPVSGYVETDPDGLLADDRRWFAVRVLPPATVAVGGAPGEAATFFLDQALAVLEEGGRIRRTGPTDADVIVAPSGAGAETRRPGSAVVVLPPADPVLLPALNRRLVAAGIPWRYELADEGAGEARVAEGHRLAVPLEGVRVFRNYRLRSSGGPLADAEVTARLEDGEPWLVSGRAAGGPYRLLASALEAESSSLPVSVVMMPVLEWMLTPGAAEAGRGGIDAGEPLSVPSGATTVEAPDGTATPVDGTQVFLRTREAGVYRILRGDSLVELVAVNPPLSESRLARMDPDEVGRLAEGRVRITDDPDAWTDLVFTSRQGPELWRPLLLVALLLLLVESWIAASGGTGGRRSAAAPTQPSADDRAGRERAPVA